jgi:hypothetical protein
MNKKQPALPARAARFDTRDMPARFDMRGDTVEDEKFFFQKT